MHIEPGLVDSSKIVLSYATAAAAGAVALRSVVSSYGQKGAVSLALRSVIATTGVFVFFEVMPHFPVGVSEVHFILGSTLFLILGAGLRTLVRRTLDRDASRTAEEPAAHRLEVGEPSLETPRCKGFGHGDAEPALAALDERRTFERSGENLATLERLLGASPLALVPHLSDPGASPALSEGAARLAAAHLKPMMRLE